MTQTLDQIRAAFAWDCASAGINQRGKDYKTLAKGAPALIMNSGLMPTLAFYNAKGGAAQQLLDDLIRGLSWRLGNKALQPGHGSRLFEPFMRDVLQKVDSREYLRYTDEALELLKWIRQFVDAVNNLQQGPR
mgnify:CR=1 FL=1